MTTTNIKKMKEQGFTIVELLIVIIVIGILAALVLVGYNNVQAQARDTKRAANATTIRNALDTFKSTDDSGVYPDVSTPANFQTAIKALKSNGTSTNTLSVQTSVSDLLVPQTGTSPSTSARDNIKVEFCPINTGTPTTAALATGAKVSYYKEVGNTTSFTTTGTGC